MLFSDGNENIGDAVQAVMAAKPLDVTMDVVPLGTQGGGDVSIQRLAVPGMVKKGQPFDARIFALSDRDQPAKVRLFRNEQLLGEQAVSLAKGKNLLSFPQSLGQAGVCGSNSAPAYDASYFFDLSAWLCGCVVPGRGPEAQCWLLSRR